MKINDYFDQVYCINLDRRADRWERMQKVFNELGVEVKRIKAIDSLEISSPEDSTPKQKARYACTESHKLAIEDAKRNDYRRVLIFEDDCIFENNFEQRLFQYLEQLPNDWDMLLLGYYVGPNFPKQLFDTGKIIKVPKNTTKADGLWAAHVYAVNNSIFNDILASENGAFTRDAHTKEGGYGCIDITYYYAFHGVKNCYALPEPLVNQDKIDSDIDKSSEETNVY